MGVHVARLSTNDLTTLATDRGSVPMQIGAVLLLDGEPAPDAAELVSVIERRLARVPRLGERLRRPPWGCGRPYWEAAPDRFAPAAWTSGAREEPITLAPAPSHEARLMSTAVAEVLLPLRQDRPLWRAVVYAGPTGRARAVVVVMHHVLADGVGGLAVLAELVDTEVDSAEDGGADDGAPGGVAAPVPPTRRALARAAWTDRWSALRSTPGALRDVAAGLRELGGVPRLRAARSSLLQPTSPRRGLDVVEVDLAGVEAAAHGRDATVNDLLLVAVSGALRRLLLARGEQLDEVVVSVPVSGRPATSSTHLGNEVGVLPVAVPLVEERAVRLSAVREQRRRLGASAPRASSGIVLSILFRTLAALRIFPWFVRRQRMVHTFLTNLRGPTEHLSLAGGRVRRVVPVAAVPGNVTVSFDALSYAGRLLVSVVYDPDHVPDHTMLREALQAELTELTRPV